MAITKPKAENQLYTVNVIVTSKNGNPCIELRKKTTEIELMQAIIRCAYHNKPMIILPSFSDKIKSLSSLIEKGIIYQAEDGYHFTM